VASEAFVDSSHDKEGRLIMEQAMAVTDGGVPYEDSSDDDE
jgi:hypothetical protein